MEGNIVGTLPNSESLVGSIGTVFGKDGASAYEIAQKNGFEGTEEEWLLSLKGERGQQGETGATGERGEQGIQGVQGIQGEKGEKGDPGEKGEKGEPGEKGADGTMTFEDLTPEQKASLKGDKGEQGERGNSGVYVGSGVMPEDCYVQIDPSGESNEEIIANIVEQAVREAVAEINKNTSITLAADKWVGTESPYTQVVSVPKVTPNSEITLKLTLAQLDIFKEKDLSFVVENDGGVVTVGCVGQKPLNDYTVQVRITEVTNI